jgi:DNA polymerase III delta subunit
MLLCYHGSDAYLLRQAITEMVGSLRERHGASLHIATVDCSDEKATEDIERQLKYPSFFGDAKLIIATNAAGPVMADILERYEVSSMDDITLIAAQNTSLKSTEKKTLTLLLQAADSAKEIQPMTGRTLETWIHEYCRLRDCTITPEAVRLLLRCVGPDMQRTTLELEKLCAYTQKGDINETSVRMLVKEPAERDEWGLSNALAAHDKRAVVASLWQKVQDGTPEPLLLGAVASGLRNLMLIKDLTVQKRPATDIAKLTGIHPFVVSKTTRGAMLADTQRLKNAYIALARLDRDAKDGITDTVDGLFSLLLTL